MSTNINFNNNLGISRGCNITLASNPITPLLLDTYPNAAVAYSLRKLRNAYSGSAIRVRRSVDNTEQDFGFDSSGNLDVNSIENFVGYNLFAWSEQLQQPYWAKTNLNVTTDTVIAPDGNTTGDILFETVTNAPHTFQRNITLTSGKLYTVSFWIKNEGRNNIRITTSSNLTNTPLIAPLAWIDLSTGTIVSQNSGFLGSNLTIIPDGSWYNVSYTLNAQASGNISVIILNLSPNGSTTSYVGDITKGAAVWGLQVTESSTIKPYRQTLDFAEGQGFITTWYDQSTNGNNAIQATAANQAQITDNGLLIIDSLTAKPTTTWTTDRYTLTTGINPNTKYLSIGVVNRTANSNNIAHIGVAGTFAGTNGQTPFAWFTTTGQVSSAMYSSLPHGNNTSTGSFITTSEKNSSDLKTVYLNGSALPITATQETAAGNVINSFGHAGGTTTTCQYQEYIYWNSEQSANRVAIETNINTYWTIYP
jgi:hypothetical protein